MPVHNYILRIYRHDAKNPKKIVGIVEDVEKRDKQAFENFEELEAIICTPEKEPSPKEKKAAKNRPNIVDTTDAIEKADRDAST